MAGGETKQRINDLEYENAILRETVARLSVKPTLRDRFALAAISGNIRCVLDDEQRVLLAQWAYEIADAMMEVRDAK